MRQEPVPVNEVEGELGEMTGSTEASSVEQPTPDFAKPRFVFGARAKWLADKCCPCVGYEATATDSKHMAASQDLEAGLPAGLPPGANFPCVYFPGIIYASSRSAVLLGSGGGGSFSYCVRIGAVCREIRSSKSTYT